MILSAFAAACKAGLRPCSPSSPNSATAPAGRCTLAELVRFEVVHHKAYPVIPYGTPWMDVLFWEVKALRVYKPQLSQRFLRLSLRICLQRRGRCISKIKISWMILLMVIYWYFVYTTVYHVICWSEQFVKSTETYQGHKFMVAGSLKSQIVSVMWRLWKVSGSRKKSPKPPKDGEPVSSLADLEPCGSDSLV